MTWIDKKNKLTKTEIQKHLLDGKTYQEIADLAGITRQRVQQIAAPPVPIARYIRKKFNYRCNECGILLGNDGGHIHHKNNKLIEDFNDIDNLMLVCPSCHRKIHGSQL